MERVIALGMAELVVDGLEAIEIEQRDGRLVLVAAVAEELLLQAPHKEAPVVEVCQRIVERWLLQAARDVPKRRVSGIEARRKGPDLVRWCSRTCAPPSVAAVTRPAIAQRVKVSKRFTAANM